MRSGTLSEASRILGRTQPAVSAALKSLEDTIGMPLFERKGRRLHPVPEAYYLLEQADEIIARVAMTTETMQNLRTMEDGALRIVSMPGPSAFLLPQLVSEFLETRKKARISVLSRSSVLVRQLIETQTYDIGIADLIKGADIGKSVKVADQQESEMLCAVQASHPLATKPEIWASDLSGAPLALLYPEHTTFKAARAAFEADGAHFNPIFEAMYFLPLLVYVEAGQAVAIVDRLSAYTYPLYRGDASKIVFRPFRPQINSGFVMLLPIHRERSRLAKAFAKFWLHRVEQINASYAAPEHLAERTLALNNT